MSKRLSERLRNRWKRLMRPPARGRPVALADDLALAVPFAASAVAPSRFRIAVMMHIFHSELAAEFRAYCEAIPAPCDILVTTDTTLKSEVITAAFSDWSKGCVSCVIVPNRGRDIAPKLTAYRDRYGCYDLILFLHSKKSDTVEWGEAWREQILSSLCGSPEVVASILTLFAHDDNLGIVAPKSFERVHEMTRWGDTADAITLAHRLGLSLNLNGTMDFPAGSMFWARPDALKPLLDLALTAEDFPEEAGQTDATVAHAIERLFYVICEHAGFSWLKVAAPSYFQNRDTLVQLDDVHALDGAVRRLSRKISQTMLN